MCTRKHKYTHLPSALIPAPPNPHHVRIIHNDQEVVVEVEHHPIPQKHRLIFSCSVAKETDWALLSLCQCQALAAELGAAGAVSI